MIIEDLSDVNSPHGNVYRSSLFLWFSFFHFYFYMLFESICQDELYMNFEPIFQNESSFVYIVFLWFSFFYFCVFIWFSFLFWFKIISETIFSRRTMSFESSFQGEPSFVYICVRWFFIFMFEFYWFIFCVLLLVFHFPFLIFLISHRLDLCRLGWTLLGLLVGCDLVGPWSHLADLVGPWLAPELWIQTRVVIDKLVKKIASPKCCLLTIVEVHYTPCVLRTIKLTVKHFDSIAICIEELCRAMKRRLSLVWPMNFVVHPNRHDRSPLYLEPPQIKLELHAYMLTTKRTIYLQLCCVLIDFWVTNSTS